jgi:hypothetical protein
MPEATVHEDSKARWTKDKVGISKHIRVSTPSGDLELAKNPNQA